MGTPYKMKGFSGFGNSPLNKTSGVGSKNKSDSKSFDIDYDEIKKDGSNNYSDPTDPKSPTYNPNHPGSDFVKPATKKEKNDAKLAKANAEYEKGLAERVSVNNPEHAKGAEGRLVALNNDHDVDDNGVPQIGAAEYYKKTGKKPKK